MKINKEYLLSQISNRYSPIFHLIFPSLIGIILIIIGVLLISNLFSIELLTIPVVLFMSFGFEWLSHKIVLHKKQPLLSRLYRLHSLHHRLYTADKMFIDSKKELYFILLPSYAIILIGIIFSPIVLLTYLAFNINIASLLLITIMVFFLVYEWLHLTYHLPNDWFISNLPGINKLRQHHQLHHQLKLMRKYNFNVTIPVFDWLFGTKIK